MLKEQNGGPLNLTLSFHQCSMLLSVYLDCRRLTDLPSTAIALGGPLNGLEGGLGVCLLWPSGLRRGVHVH